MIKTEPVLIVEQMKLGADARGAVGWFVDISTEGFLRS